MRYNKFNVQWTSVLLGSLRRLILGVGQIPFQDWSDHIVTVRDSTMPGIYEVMEWIVHT